MTRVELDRLTACGADGRAAVLHDVSLDVADGELVAVVGGSGSGKSTLLRALIGLADVPSGTLRLDGEPATDWAPAERDLAMVFQDHAPYPHLRVRDNLALPLRLAGVPGGVIARQVAAVADTLGLSVHLDRWPSQLSGGQRQRVAVGRVLIRPAPGAYLLDEPLSADPALRTRLRGLLGGRTTLWATPEVAEAAAVGDRVAVLRDGRLIQVGTPQQLAERPTSLDVAAMAPLNVLRGTIADGALRLPIGTLPVDRPAGEVLVGIRPADLTERGDGVRIPLLVGDG
ncbi:MAG TPA: ABC transporter ATP-binding protein, partial [Mycobacteriales bacterium]|nr:ABC transporter ATP-binding protein [Mycobacteriales bacterium]